MSDLEAERVFARVAQSMLGEAIESPRIGRFVLRDKLGEGAMGKVYGASDPETGAEVAIKVLRPECEDDPTAMRRLEREARALAKLRHANVVRIHEVGRVDDRLFIATERLAGETLRDRLEREGRLSAAETRAIVTQICAALTEAHRLGIVHRDLKPANVFLTGDGVKVLDFGVAKTIGGGTLGASTATGAVLGTPHYMSPEQATDSKRIDHRADLWAVGVIAFECMVGRRPFEAQGLAELAVAIVTGDPPVPSHHADVPAGFDAWFARAVARDPAARFQSADELARAFEAALDGPTRTRSPSRGRWYAAIGLATVGAMLLALWLGGAFATPQRDDAPAPAPEPTTRPPAVASEPATAVPATAEPDAPDAKHEAPEKPRSRPAKRRRASVDDLEF